ncbi:uncharacterized protein DUF1826 [Paracoccus pantotrophus]|uniref:DUF1826 domain-containing protein n=1 Tax=Paracoccus pantotrophus TaxID=82367 RepID=A0AAE6NWY4_PARPN|nr:DUF1826 domain-containing protein [Paracoccus pantotrophus]QFG37418.1 DUF1826 domain-containing protein [Paracoccus pantotrophus]RKS52138.1 uncharacterized protein DUF1826 [Paracoccus pantotrophus]
MAKTDTAIPQMPHPGAAKARGILESSSGLVLEQITRPGVGAAIWRRNRSPGFAEWIESIPPGQLPALRAVADFRTIERGVHAACDLSGLPAGTMRDLLASDIGALALMLARIMRNPLMHIRFEAVTTDACRRFHVDQLPARLLCTYRGPETQFGLEDENGRIVRAGAMRSGEVAVLRGASWPGMEVTGLLHRSPPIAGTGKVRLFLALDPMVEPAEARRLH